MSNLDYVLQALLWLFTFIIFTISCVLTTRISKLEDFLNISYSTESFYVQKGD